MKRTLLLIAAIVVAAVGAGTLALWANTAAKHNPVRTVHVPVVAPAGAGPGQVQLSIAANWVGVVPGRVDILAAGGGRAGVLLHDVEAIQVKDGLPVVVAVPETDALTLLRAQQQGMALTLVQRVPGGNPSADPTTDPALAAPPTAD